MSAARGRSTANLAGFQLAWWSCVLSVRAHAAWVGVAAVLALAAAHLCFAANRRTEARFLLAATGIGYAADAAAAWSGAVAFPADFEPLLPAPGWVAALWLAFATTVGTTFAALRRPLWRAAALGALAGPVSYGAGAALGVVALPLGWRSLAALAVLWALALPLIFRISPVGAGGAST